MDEPLELQQQQVIGVDQLTGHIHVVTEIGTEV